MSKTKQYSPEVKERAVRLVQEARKDYPSLWAAVESIAPKIGCAGATLYEWVKRHEIDSGLRDGMMAGRTEVSSGWGRERNRCRPSWPERRNLSRSTDTR